MKSFEEVYGFSLGVEGNGTHPHPTCTATADELRVFIPHVLALSPGSRVVEIGTYTGRSASVYLQVQKELDLDLHFIDFLIWNPDHAAKSFWNDLVVKHFHDASFTYHKSLTNDAAKAWNLPIDFLYIDGEHEAPSVDHDFANWTPWLKSGGIMAAHDSQIDTVAACLDRFCKAQGWQLLDSAERMTIWRKP